MARAIIDPASLTGRLLRLPLRLIPQRAVMPVLTGINKGCRWRVGSSIHGCWLGNYESDKQRLISRLVKPGMSAWDIGANAGFYTLAMSRLAGHDGCVHAFEPLPGNAAHVHEHIGFNNCANVILHQIALSDRKGEAAFRTANSNAMGHLATGGDLHVQTAAMDGLIEDGVPAPDIVKMDVEGAESLVLDGARKLLGMQRTIWLIALHGEEQRKAVGRILGEYGYRLFTLGGEEISGVVDVDEIYALPDGIPGRRM